MIRYSHAPLLGNKSFVGDLTIVISLFLFCMQFFVVFVKILVSNVACLSNLGDPMDRTLRKVEKEVVIPKMMTAKAKELCHSEVKGKMVEVKRGFMLLW